MGKKKWILAVCIVLALMLLAINGVMLFLYTNHSFTKADRQLAKGQKYLSDEKYDEAIQIFNEIITDDDRNVEAYLGLVQAYKADGQLKRARDTRAKGYELTQDEALAGEITIITWEESQKTDKSIQWKDYGVEQAVRQMTGIKEGDIMLSDIWEISDYYLYESNISDLSDLKNFPNLTSLYLYNSNITDLEMLEDFKNLEKLYLSDNEITNLEPLEHLSNLVWLDVSNNQIEDIESLKKLKNLVHLDLSGNRISNAEAIEGMKDLEYLNLSDNPIADISVLKKMNQMNTLYLEYMPITDIQVLSSLDKLQRLSLKGDSYIEDYRVLSELSHIEELNLAHTGIYELGVLHNLKELTYLNLAGANVSDLSPVSQVEYVSY